MTSSDELLERAKAGYEKHARFILSNWLRYGKPAALPIRLNLVETDDGVRPRVYYHIELFANWEGHRWIDVGVSLEGAFVTPIKTVHMHVPVPTTETQH